MIFAVAMFSCLDATAKWLGRTMAPPEIAWLRYATHVIYLAVFWRVWQDLSPFRTKKPLMQILRGFTLLGSTFFNFWAIQYLQLAEASAIMFAGPLVVTALAGPVLGEKVGVRRWAAVCVGFVGVLIVTRPGTGAMHWAALLSVCAMLNYAAYSLLTRRMHRTESPRALIMLSGMVGAVALLPFAPAAVTNVEGWLWILALLTGAFGAIGHGAMVMAHKLANASVLAPFAYTQMIWMITWGLVIFGDWPDTWTLVGTAVIASAGLYILHRERVRGQEVASREPAAVQ
jgi:drug/metabolite transporter (DMT)-like permease